MADAELDFLVHEYGFTKQLSPTSDFEVRYARDRCVVRLEGRGFGSDASVFVFLDDRHLPLYLMVPDIRARRTAKTDSPQLDHIREGAARLRQHLIEYLRGDYAIALDALRRHQEAEDEKERRRTADPRNVFFSTADKLWKNRCWQELGSHLRSSPYKLSAVWQQRLEEADAKF